jgi:hypothetical protein
VPSTSILLAPENDFNRRERALGRQHSLTVGLIDTPYIRASRQMAKRITNGRTPPAQPDDSEGSDLYTTDEDKEDTADEEEFKYS